jgi:hypothetical protein
MKKGSRCPFDAAVAVNLPQYRVESDKIDLCDSLILELNSMMNNLEKQIAVFENKCLNLNELNTAYENELIRKTKLNTDLFIEYQKLSIAYAKEKTWLKKNGKWFAFGAGVIVGIVGTHYIIN